MSGFQAFKDYLDLHQRERRGLIALVLLITVSFIVMAAIPHFVKPEFENKNHFEKQMSDLIRRQDSLKLIKDSLYKAEKSSKKRNYSENKYNSESKEKFSKLEAELFDFDPNTTSDKNWQRLGLNSGQIKTVKKYLSKGGKFFVPEDLSKIYSIPDDQFSQLKPFVKIKSEVRKSDFTDNKVVDPYESKEIDYEILQINLNTADTTELIQLRGIGPFYARKIVELRNELGGFVSKDQLLELWKFDKEKLDQISENLIIKENETSLIRINFCTAEELQTHPYVSWNQAKGLVAYREQHGSFNSADEITKCHLISDELCQKIKPYLKID